MTELNRGDQIEWGDNTFIITGIDAQQSKNPDEPAWINIRAMSLEEARKRRDSLNELLGEQ